MARFASQTAEPPTPTVDRPTDALSQDAKVATPFVPASTLASRVTLLLAFTITLSLAHLGLQYAQIRLLASVPARRVVAQGNLLGTWQTAFTVAELLALLITTVFFLLWVYRVRTNLPALGARELQFSPRWAVAGFLVPVLNLVLPVRVIEEIWKASDPDLVNSQDWRSTRASRLIEWWWGAFLLAQLLDKFTARAAMGAGRTASDLQFIGWITVVSEVLAVLAGLMAILIVRGIQSRQEEKDRRRAPSRVWRDELVPA